MRKVMVSVGWLSAANGMRFLETLLEIAERDETYSFKVVKEWADITFVVLEDYLDRDLREDIDATGAFVSHVVVLVPADASTRNSTQFLIEHPRVLAILPFPQDSKEAEEQLFRLAARVAWPF